MSAAYWICAAITAISSAVSLGYSIAAVTRAEALARTNALYAGARSTALAVGAIVALFAQSASYLAAVAAAMVVVQALDAGIGWLIRDRLKTLGPALTSATNVAALIWLLQQ